MLYGRYEHDPVILNSFDNPNAPMLEMSRIAAPNDRTPFVFEKTLFDGQRLDAAQLTPLLDTLFAPGLTEDQQKRLLRQMEREQKQRFVEYAKAEAERRSKEEEQRRHANFSADCEEYERLRGMYHDVASRLEAKTQREDMTTVLAANEGQQTSESQEQQQGEEVEETTVFAKRAIPHQYPVGDDPCSVRRRALFEALQFASRYDQSTSATSTTSSSHQEEYERHRKLANISPPRSRSACSCCNQDSLSPPCGSTSPSSHLPGRAASTTPYISSSSPLSLDVRKRDGDAGGGGGNVDNKTETGNPNVVEETDGGVVVVAAAAEATPTPHDNSHQATPNTKVPVAVENGSGSRGGKNRKTDGSMMTNLPKYLVKQNRRNVVQL